ncbi:hypothetical protein BC343_25770 [Mucilaginibacter pedocola]|uniref:Response regulatory domain-containing protein n=2 Tax=Mucilaginibacter pedocola TaxID=1792845 RepID=A0A1S9PHJ7_9SPHI|nr:hypothetical protein BC343_25770 [Mucilaginibacter pedocola]
MPETILLVEDDQDILDIMFYMLSDEGYQVLRSSGEDALDQAITGKPDLILLDHRLQTGWGADICRVLKSDTSTKNIPVVMVSAAMHMEETAREAGADGVLHKPFDMHQLLNLVAGICRPPAEPQP